MTIITENILENTCLEWFSELGWNILYGPDLAPGMPGAEREDYRQVLLLDRLRDALLRINPDDLVAFMNGLPPAVLELKNPGEESATVKQAFHRLQTYKKDIPSLFTANELLVISDGIQARCGTLTSGWDRFMPWLVHHRWGNDRTQGDSGTGNLDPWVVREKGFSGLHPEYRCV